jgi:RecJ-like exonuclease
VLDPDRCPDCIGGNAGWGLSIFSKCATCDGTGKRVRKVTCYACNGSTWLDSDLGRRCPTCDGTGKVTVDYRPIVVGSRKSVREAALSGRIGQELEQS